MKNLYNIILFSVLFIILSFKSWSLPICNDNDDVWNNCFGTYEHTEGDAKGEIIKGEFLNNYLNGYGAIYYNDGSIYKGNLKNNIANGLGFETYTGEYKGHAYIGEFLNGKRHGKGVYFYSDGKTEIGIFKNGYYSYSQNCPKDNTVEWDNCYGYYQHNEGDHKGESYEGWFKNDEYHGIGIYRYNNGDSYSGEFKNGDFDGYGVFEYANGKKDDGIHKKGEFQHTLDLDTQIDKPKIVENYNSNKTCPEDVNVVWDNCFTVYSFPKGHESYGDRYEGMIKNDLWHGQGTYYYSNGDKYVGEFKEGLPNGHGTHTDAYGNKYVAEFKDGIPTGQGTITYFEGSKYVGELKNGQAHGKGTFTFPDGYSLEGVWEKNEYIRDVRKQSNTTNLTTKTKRQEEYFSPSNSAFEWLPYIVGNAILIGLVVYINYYQYINNEATLWEIFSNALIWLSIGGIIAYILHPKER